jgi:DNA-binding NtrC family response regulator
MATILIVDDDQLQASLNHSILNKRFTDVRRVADPDEALSLIEQQPFAENLGAVIIGHFAAGFGGTAFVAELRGRMFGLQILVIGEKGETPRDYPWDGVHFERKPVSTHQLLSIVDTMVARHLGHHTV